MMLEGYQKSNVLLIRTQNAGSVMLNGTSPSPKALNVGDEITMDGWRVKRKDADNITVFRPKENTGPLTITFDPTVSVSAEAWTKTRTQTKWGETPVQENVANIRFDRDDISFGWRVQSHNPAPAPTEPPAPTVPPVDAGRIDALQQEVNNLREALTLQGQTAALGLDGARALRSRLQAEYDEAARELQELEDESRELEQKYDVLHLNRANALEHINTLKGELDAVQDAVTVGKLPGTDFPPFKKLLKDAAKSIETLQKAYGFILEGNELIMDSRGRAVMTSGHVSAEEDHISDLPAALRSNDAPDEPDDPRFDNLYDPAEPPEAQ